VHTNRLLFRAILGLEQVVVAGGSLVVTLTIPDDSGKTLADQCLGNISATVGETAAIIHCS